MHSVSWEGVGPPAPAEALGRPGLTPGSVFCSCRALWAFRAESRAQYVRKAHPEEGQGQRDPVGVSPGSPLPKSPPPPRRMRSGKLVPSCHVLPAGVGEAF